MDQIEEICTVESFGQPRAVTIEVSASMRVTLPNEIAEVFHDILLLDFEYRADTPERGEATATISFDIAYRDAFSALIRRLDTINPKVHVIRFNIRA